MIPIDEVSKDGNTQMEREKAKANLWRIDKAIDDGQVAPLPEDGKRPLNTIIIPDGRNSV